MSKFSYQGWHEDFGDEPSVEERYPSDHDFDEIHGNEDYWQDDATPFVVLARRNGETEVKELGTATGAHEAAYLTNNYAVGYGLGWSVWAEEIN